MFKIKYKASHRRAFLDTLYISIFTFLPTFLSFIFIVIGKEKFEISKFYKAGEFLLYAISFFSSSFLVYNQLNFKKTDWKNEINIWIMISTLLVAVFFAAGTTVKDPDLSFLNWTSIISLSVSMIAFYHSQFLNNKKSPDIGEARRDEQDDIMRNLLQ